MSMTEFIKSNREALVSAIVKRCPNISQPVSESEIRLWVLNDEQLYNWAKAEGVRV